MQYIFGILEAYWSIQGSFCFWGLKFYQKWPQSSLLTLNWSKTPLRSGVRICWLLLFRGGCFAWSWIFVSSEGGRNNSFEVTRFTAPLTSPMANFKETCFLMFGFDGGFFLGSFSSFSIPEAYFSKVLPERYAFYHLLWSYLSYF